MFKPIQVGFEVTCTAVLAVVVMDALPAIASSFNANDFNSLSSAITAANLQPTSSTTINITGDITLSGLLPQITSNIDFVGNNHFIDGNNSYEDFFVNSGTVNFSNLTIENGLARGGNGGPGAGGGAGLGGGLFINNGTVTADNVTFLGNQAYGGNGGNGGFLGGNGGGGGANGGNGGNGSRAGGNGGNGSLGGKGGNGAGVGFLPAGDGSFGGGGGGAGFIAPGVGNGGFGGGGGGSGVFSPGGNGGFGGGGGGRFGLGGSFGGNGGSFNMANVGGGGGAGGGLGGAIFVNTGSLTLSNTTFTNNSAFGGLRGDSSATNGQGKGGAIFVNSDGEVNSLGFLVASSNTASDASDTSTDNNNFFGVSLDLVSPPQSVPEPDFIFPSLAIAGWFTTTSVKKLKRRRSKQ